MSLWPRTLFGRVTMIVCGGLALAHLLTILIILRERGDQGLAMMSAYLGRDVAASVAMLDRLSPTERAAWLPRLARQNYHYTLDAAPLEPPSRHALAAPLTQAIVAELGAARVGTMVPDAAASQQGTPKFTAPGLHLALRLQDGAPLTLWLSPPRPLVSRTTLLLLALQLSTLALAAWFGVRLAVRPLAQLADAARTLTPGRNHISLSEAGPQEVAQAARAFNAMQARIEAHLAERMQLLAAISHDLQTPITRMRVRTDGLADNTLRGKLQADLAEMQALVEEGLAYARTAHAEQEPICRVDLNALLDGLVCDARDAGHQVDLIGQLDQPVDTRLQALRRVVSNLLDNAIKFGGSAQVLLEARGTAVCIRVRDSGPGIPPEALQAVLQPFVRLDSSRNRDTGGTGLGLAIAHQLALALPAQLVLRNRPEGGLEACLTLMARAR